MMQNYSLIQAYSFYQQIHPKEKLGRIAGHHLMRMMEDKDWQTKNYSYRFPVKLNDGNSVKKL